MKRLGGREGGGCGVELNVGLHVRWCIIDSSED